MSAFAKAVSVLVLLPPNDEAAAAGARDTLADLLNGSRNARAHVRALAIEDRCSNRGESAGQAGRVVDAVLGLGDEAWPDVPSLPGPPDPEPLPLDALPPLVRAHVESVAGATQTPTDLPALLSLAAISTAVGGRAVVAVDERGWVEPVNIYAAAILPPASRKSPVFAAMIAPLEAWEREERERAGPVHHRARDAAEIAEDAFAATKKAAAKGNATADEVDAARAEFEQARAAVSPFPRLLAADATPEALVLLMADQGGRIALLAPEADPLGIADGRYADGKARVDELLRAWSGEAIRVDRVGRDPVHIDRPALTLGLTLQPAVLADLSHGKTFRGRGLLGRVLWAVPAHGLGTRRTGRDVPGVDQRAAAQYDATLRQLLSAAGPAAPPQYPHNPPGGAVPGSSAGLAGAFTLRLSDGALDVLYGYEAEIEVGLADGGRLAGIRDWAGKAAGQAIRLATLIELAARAEDQRPLWAEPVGEWAMEAGVRLVRAFTTHALMVLGGVGVDRRIADMRYVLRRAGEIPVESTLKDLHDATRDRPGLETMDALRPVVDELAEWGCIRLVEQVREGPGRPPSPLVVLHPALSGGAPNLHPLNPRNPAAGPAAGHSAGFAGAVPAPAPAPALHPADRFLAMGGDGDEVEDADARTTEDILPDAVWEEAEQ
jgi:replicative DNA helicase